MRIGINGYEAVIARFGYDAVTGLPNRVGSGEVCFQWLTWLSRTDKKNSYIIYLPTKPTPDLPEESDRWKYKIIKAQRLWSIFGLSKALRREKSLDVFFTPTHYAPFFVPCPQVISILDVSYKKFPELFNKSDLYKLAMWGKYSVKRAAAVVTISASSKNDIIDEYKIPAQKVAVAHLGIKESLRNSMPKEELFKKYSLSSPYILFVGTLQPRKNVRRLIEAFAVLKKKEKDIALVIIGKKGWQYEEILSAPKEFHVADSVKFLDSVTDDELPTFYKYAEVFVLPSLYEGFGLPVLEAMKYGCPVITSNISSLPEAGGDAAIYVDPKNVDDIAVKIESVLKDSKVRERMVKKGHEQIKKFTWEESAQKVLSVLTSVGNHE